MKDVAKFFKTLSDETRLRILMLLTRRELCVCQLMGVLGVSQPLISRNLSLLEGAGLLQTRKDGKLVFYSMNDDMPQAMRQTINLLNLMLEGNKMFLEDLDSLQECTEFQKRTGKCDMKTFLDFMEQKRRQRRGEV